MKRRLSRKRKKYLKTFIFSDRHIRLDWSKAEWLSEWDLHLMWFCGGSFLLEVGRGSKSNRSLEILEEEIWSEVANLA